METPDLIIAIDDGNNFQQTKGRFTMFRNDFNFEDDFHKTIRLFR